MGRDARFNPNAAKIREFGKVPIIGGGVGAALGLPLVAKDAYNRELAVGDLLHIQPARPQPYQVQAIEEVAGSPEFVDVVLVSEIRFRTGRNLPTHEMTRVMTAGERTPVETPQREWAPDAQDAPQAPSQDPQEPSGD